MKKVNITQRKQIIFASDFNLPFGNDLKAKVGKPILKEISVARVV